jgi:hypothetical protein
MIANIFTTLAKALRGDNVEHRTFVDWTDDTKNLKAPQDDENLLLVTLHSSLKNKDYYVALPDTPDNRAVLDDMDKGDIIKAPIVRGSALLKEEDNLRHVSVVNAIEYDTWSNAKFFPPFTPFG